MTKPSPLLLTIVALFGCRPSSVADQTPVARGDLDAPTASIDADRPPAPDELFEDPFVFSIGGMKKINGAL